jgi:hypothetical protein
MIDGLYKMAFKNEFNRQIIALVLVQMDIEYCFLLNY